jgi:hypothetical protein
MSRLLSMNSDDLRDLADGIDLLTKARKTYGVGVTAYGNADVAVGENVVSIRWDDEMCRYVVDDRNGS